VHDEFAPFYTLRAKMFRDDETDLFWPRTGYVTRPGLVWVPSDSASTPDASAAP
jgi:hypothetical protein